MRCLTLLLLSSFLSPTTPRTLSPTTPRQLDIDCISQLAKLLQSNSLITEEVDGGFEISDAQCAGVFPKQNGRGLQIKKNSAYIGNETVPIMYRQIGSEQKLREQVGEEKMWRFRGPGLVLTTKKNGRYQLGCLPGQECGLAFAIKDSVLTPAEIKKRLSPKRNGNRFGIVVAALGAFVVFANTKERWEDLNKRKKEMTHVCERLKDPMQVLKKLYHNKVASTVELSKEDFDDDGKQEFFKDTTDTETQENNNSQKHEIEIINYSIFLKKLIHATKETLIETEETDLENAQEAKKTTFCKIHFKYLSANKSLAEELSLTDELEKLNTKLLNQLNCDESSISVLDEEKQADIYNPHIAIQIEQTEFDSADKDIREIKKLSESLSFLVFFLVENPDSYEHHDIIPDIMPDCFGSENKHEYLLLYDQLKNKATSRWYYETLRNHTWIKFQELVDEDKKVILEKHYKIASDSFKDNNEQHFIEISQELGRFKVQVNALSSLKDISGNLIELSESSDSVVSINNSDLEHVLEYLKNNKEKAIYDLNQNNECLLITSFDLNFSDEPRIMSLKRFYLTLIEFLERDLDTNTNQLDNNLIQALTQAAYNSRSDIIEEKIRLLRNQQQKLQEAQIDNIYTFLNTLLDSNVSNFDVERLCLYGLLPVIQQDSKFFTEIQTLNKEFSSNYVDQQEFDQFKQTIDKMCEESEVPNIDMSQNLKKGLIKNVEAVLKSKHDTAGFTLNEAKSTSQGSFQNNYSNIPGTSIWILNNSSKEQKFTIACLESDLITEPIFGNKEELRLVDRPENIEYLPKGDHYFKDTLYQIICDLDSSDNFIAPNDQVLTRPISSYEFFNEESKMIKIFGTNIYSQLKNSKFNIEAHLVFNTTQQGYYQFAKRIRIDMAKGTKIDMAKGTKIDMGKGTKIDRNGKIYLHGTNKMGAQSIIKGYGFDSSCTFNTVHGNGVYFTKSIETAIKYSQVKVSDKIRYVVVAKSRHIPVEKNNPLEALRVVKTLDGEYFIFNTTSARVGLVPIAVLKLTPKQ